MLRLVRDTAITEFAGLLCADKDRSAVDQLAALLLLISPFFFWGTSMVAFKAGHSPHHPACFLQLHCHKNI